MLRPAWPSRGARRAPGDRKERGTRTVGGLREALRIIRVERDIWCLILMLLMFMPIFGAFEIFLALFCEKDWDRPIITPWPAPRWERGSPWAAYSLTGS